MEFLENILDVNIFFHFINNNNIIIININLILYYYTIYL